MSVNVSSRKSILLNVRIAYPGVLGGGLPQLAPGWAFLTDDAGNFLLDDSGNYLVVELV